MRVFSRSTALLALLTPIIDAVSLSDMTPRAQNLPPDCDKIYTSQISGCGIPDFTTSSCTQTCVSALQALVGPIKDACGGHGVTGQNLVVAFLANVGPQQICPNAQLDSSSSSSSQQQESTPSPTPSPAPSPSTTSTTAAAETTEASSSSIASESLLVDTSSRESTRTRTRTPAFSGTTTAPTLTASQSFAPTTEVDHSSRTHTTTAAAAQASSTTGETEDDGQQAAEDRSGGGSPFDEEGNMFSGADSLSSTSVLVSLGIAFVVVVVLFR